MKKLLFAFTFFVVIVSNLVPMKARASHGAGGELIYEWISDSTYRFFFKCYRDCTGIPALPGPYPLCGVPNCSNTSALSQISASMTAWTGNLPGGGQNGSFLSSGCSNASTKCQDPSSPVPGYEEDWFSAIVTLPGQCNFWTFSTTLSARNSSVNAPGGGNLHLETTFNNYYFQGNSSPYFSIKPIPYVCVNAPYTFNNGAIDPNNDSLSTDLVQPQTDGAGCAPTPVGMFGGFSLPSNPFACGNSMVVNSKTGQLNFTPSATGGQTITTRVREYRHGILIGYITRDVQIQVLTCSSVAPNLTPIPQTSIGGIIVNGVAQGCVNQNLSFCFDSKSTDPGAVLLAQDNHIYALPAASVTYTNTGTDSLRGCFSWTPGPTDTGAKGFIVTIKDSTCRPPGIMIYYPIIVNIYIWAPTIALKDTNICPGQSGFLTAYGGGNFQWSELPGGDNNKLSCYNCTSPVASPLQKTSYVALSTVDPYCPNINKDTVTVNVLAAPIFTNHNDTTTCPHNPVMLDLKPTPPAGITYRYKWTPNTYLSNDTISNPVSNPYKSVKYKVTISNSASVCLNFDTINVDVLAGFFVENIDTEICDGQSVQVRGSGDSRYTYTWLTDPLANATQSSPGAITTSFTPGLIGKYAYTLKASYTNCLDSIYAFNIELQPNPKVKVNDDAKICFGDTMRLNGLVTPSNFPYKLHWTPGVALDDPTSASPIFSANTKGVNTLTLIASSSAGCSDSDKVDLTVFPAKFLGVSNDTAICAGDSVQLHLTATGPKSFVWTPDINISNKRGYDPYVWPTATQTYRVYGIDTNSCADTVTVKITLKPAAILDMPDSVKLYPGDVYHVQPGGNCLYFNWFPPLGLSKSNISNPLIHPDVNTRYIVNARTEEGCVVTDSLDVLVMNDSYVDLPNAFVPGNGPNGTLKPVHLGSATLKSFVIYNRWGVKMYEGKDINSGWDGRFNGEPQPLGVYVYTIEAVTPSGKTVTRQGNVTLIR